MDYFETANVVVALGGDINNTVPKANVTAAEIALLQAIHGNDAVIEIEPNGTVKRSNRVERVRLTAEYGKAQDHNGKPIIDGLFPGAAARLFQRIDELLLSPAQFLPGKAPEGLEDAQQAEADAIQDGLLLADGSMPDREDDTADALA